MTLRFPIAFTICHPSLRKFIDIMKQKEGLVGAGVLQNQGGHPPPPCLHYFHEIYKTDILFY